MAVHGTTFRVLTAVDVYTRECKALVARRRFRGEDVAAGFTDLMTHEGRPATIQCDQGTEFTSLAMDAWAYWQHIPLDSSRRGTPGDNAVNEAFNRSLRRERLSQHHFLSLRDAQQILDTRRKAGVAKPRGCPSLHDLTTSPRSIQLSASRSGFLAPHELDHIDCRQEHDPIA